MTAKITGVVSGGDKYEHLIVDGSTVTTKVTDVINNTTISITGDASVTEGGTANYTLPRRPTSSLLPGPLLLFLPARHRPFSSPLATAPSPPHAAPPPFGAHGEVSSVAFSHLYRPFLLHRLRSPHTPVRPHPTTHGRASTAQETALAPRFRFCPPTRRR